MVFTESVGLRDSNEVDLLNIRRALTIWKDCGKGPLVIEGDSTNAIKWAKGLKCPLWKLVSIVKEIKGLSLGMDVSLFKWVGQ